MTIPLWKVHCMEPGCTYTNERIVLSGDAINSAQIHKARSGHKLVVVEEMTF